MSEFTGVGLGVQTPDVVGKLSQLLSVKAQQQALRGQAAEVAGAEQTQRQRAGIADYMKNKLPKYTLEDGTIDLPSISSDPELFAAAGDKTDEILQGLAHVKEFQVGARAKLLELDEAKRKGVVEVATALLGDEDINADPGTPDNPNPKFKEQNERAKQKLNDALTSYYEIHGKDVLPAIATYKATMDKAQPGGLPAVLRSMQMGAMSADSQVAAQRPQFVSKGDALTNVSPTAAPTPDIAIGLPPGVYTDANGAQFRIDNNGRRVSELGKGGGQGGPSAKPTEEPRKFTQPVPGQKDLEEHVTQTRKADSDYGQNRHVNEEILRLSADTATGPGTKAWHAALGQITGLGGGNQIADFQKIGAYLDRQSALAGQQMGLPETNAGLQTAANLSGTTEYAPEALQTKVKLTDAMVEGAHQYRQGLDKVIGTGPNQDLSKLNEFRNQWADNFDPNIYRAENAIKRGDKKELAEIKEEVGTRGMADLKRKRDNLHKLEAGELLK